jgi:hypothetical protein
MRLSGELVKGLPGFPGFPRFAAFCRAARKRYLPKQHQDKCLYAKTGWRL